MFFFFPDFKEKKNQENCFVRIFVFLGELFPFLWRFFQDFLFCWDFFFFFFW